jgi:hypothetical protein
MIKELFIKDLIEPIVEAMVTTPTPKFMYGYWPEIHDEIMDLAKVDNYIRYPFILLHAEYTEDKTNSYFYAEVDPTIYIVSISEQNYSTIDREDLVYKTINYPLYNELMQGLIDSHDYMIDDDIPHTVKKLHYRRGEDPSKENPLSEYIEVLEIKIQSLKILKKYTC